MIQEITRIAETTKRYRKVSLFRGNRAASGEAAIPREIRTADWSTLNDPVPAESLEVVSVQRASVGGVGDPRRPRSSKPRGICRRPGKGVEHSLARAKRGETLEGNTRGGEYSCKGLPPPLIGRFYCPGIFRSGLKSR